METNVGAPCRISGWIFAGCPSLAGSIQQILCTQNIGLQEELRILDTTVHMTFGGKIDYIIKCILGKQLICQFAVADVSFDKKATFVVDVAGDRSQITGIR